MDREVAAFIAYLDAERDHVLGVLEGLEDADLRRPVLPTGWSCLGLVRHLTVDVERLWFRGVVAGEPEVTARLKPGLSAHWKLPEGMGAEAVFADYRAEIERANCVLAAIGQDGRGLDRAPRVWPDELWPNWRLPDLRSVLLHVLTELSCHAGHLDAARELIDGKTWSGPDPYAA
jgi:hypothetical protein